MAAAGEARPYDLNKLKRDYRNFLTSKKNEMDEREIAREYYHGKQWSDAAVATLNKRNQPVITYNRVSRKINGVVGLLERLRQDPKAFPRTPTQQQEKAADLSTAVLRYALDTNDWRSLSADIGRNGAIDGIGGLEMSLEMGDQGDPDIKLDIVDPEDFFYDPRSIRPDFSDARYMGVAKWLDINAAIDMFPDFEQEIRDHCNTSGEEGRWDAKEVRWSMGTEGNRKVRLVEHWFLERGDWNFCFYTGSLHLVSGVSPFLDEKGQTLCRFIMFSNGIDHDADRYGFCRDLKGPQDEINQRRSKGLHLFNSRRVITEKGAVDDPERARLEVAKPDGFIEVNPGLRFEFDDAARQADAAGNLQMLTEAKSELENFGPNPALVGQGTGVAGSSGRAIALLQQAGIAELGPYIIRYRAWKLRVYRAVWNAIQQHWSSQRWIRVTDDEEIVQFIQVNGIENGPFGPVFVNMLGNLDVDIILDEGPDQINSMADAYDTLIAMTQRGYQVPPDVIVELSSLPGNVKKRILSKLEQASQPDPAQEMVKQIGVQGAAASVAKEQAQAEKTALEAKQLEQELAMKPFETLADLSLQERALQAKTQQAERPTYAPG